MGGFAGWVSWAPWEFRWVGCLWPTLAPFQACSRCTVVADSQLDRQACRGIVKRAEDTNINRVARFGAVESHLNISRSRGTIVSAIDSVNGGGELHSFFGGKTAVAQPLELWERVGNLLVYT